MTILKTLKKKYGKSMQKNVFYYCNKNWNPIYKSDLKKRKIKYIVI